MELSQLNKKCSEKFCSQQRPQPVPGGGGVCPTLFIANKLGYQLPPTTTLVDVTWTWTWTLIPKAHHDVQDELWRVMSERRDCWMSMLDGGGSCHCLNCLRKRGGEGREERGGYQLIVPANSLTHTDGNIQEGRHTNIMLHLEAARELFIMVTTLSCQSSHSAYVDQHCKQFIISNI